MTGSKGPMTAEDRRLWEAASEQDRARSEKTLADLIEEDRADPTTPDHFDVPLKALEQVEEELGDGRRLGIGGNTYNIQKFKEAAQLLREWGWTVVFMDGWSTRGASRRQLSVQYIGDHHTAAEVDVDRILRDGRSDVPGPLCEVAVHADSTIVIVAAGPANHFGVATIDSSDALGVENTGPIPINASGKSAFPNYRATLAVYVAFRRVYGLGTARIVLHKETARPIGRKIDRAVDGDTVRREAAVTEVLADGSEGQDEFDMRTDAEIVELARQGAAKALNALTVFGQPNFVETIKALYNEVRAQADDQARITDAIAAAQGAVLGALTTATVDLSDADIDRLAEQTGLTPDAIEAAVRRVFADAGQAESTT